MGSFGFASDKYDVTALENLLAGYLGSRTLSQLLKPCLIPAYQLERAATYFFCRQDHDNGVDPEREFLLRDLCRATSAAPSYFKPASFSSAANVPHSFVDGGVFANNPTLCAIAEVGKTVAQFTPLNMALMSLGTGNLKQSFKSASFSDRIALLNIPDLIKIMMGGVAETTHYIVRNVFTNLDIADSYLRLDPLMDDPKVASMDNATPENIQRLQDITAGFIEDNDDKLELWAKQLMISPDVDGRPALQFKKPLQA